MIKTLKKKKKEKQTQYDLTCIMESKMVKFIIAESRIVVARANEWRRGKQGVDVQFIQNFGL